MIPTVRTAFITSLPQRPQCRQGGGGGQSSTGLKGCQLGMGISPILKGPDTSKGRLRNINLHLIPNLLRFIRLD